MDSPTLGLVRLPKSLLRPWQKYNPATRRLLLILALTLMWDVAMMASGAGGTSPWRGLTLLASVAIYPLLVALIAVILREPAPRWLSHLPIHKLIDLTPIILVSVAAAITVQVPYLLRPTKSVSTDITSSIICASREAMHGSNPYSESDFACLKSLHLPISMGTVLQRGVFARQSTTPTYTQIAAVVARSKAHHWNNPAFAVFGYPPMSFIFMMPAASGSRVTWVAYTLLAGLALVLLVGLAAGELWPAAVLVLLMQLGYGELLGSALQGDGELFAYGLLVLALSWLDKPRLSGVLIGLAMAAHPLAWVVWFGYSLFTSTKPHFKQRIVYSLGTALLLVLPWLIQEPHAAGSMLQLIFQPNYPIGSGVIALFGTAPPSLLRPVLLLAVVAAFAGFSVFAWQHQAWLATLPVVSLSFMWVGWRSDLSYLGEVFALAAAMTIGLHRSNPNRTKPLSSLVPAATTSAADS